MIEGVLDHVVDGISYVLTPGMAGFVNAGDQVIHRVPGDEPVRTLVIWVPAGESEGLRNAWQREDIGQ